MTKLTNEEMDRIKTWLSENKKFAILTQQDATHMATQCHLKLGRLEEAGVLKRPDDRKARNFPLHERGFLIDHDMLKDMQTQQVPHR